MQGMNTAMIWQTESISSEDSQKLAQKMGELLKPPKVVELVGDLGAGKTTFARGLVKGLGSDSDVSSPSFSLSNIYRLSSGVEVHHFDFYRLEEPGVMRQQILEAIEDEKSFVIIEWADTVRNLLPKSTIKIELKPTIDNPDRRIITINYPEKFHNVIAQLEQSRLS